MQHRLHTGIPVLLILFFCSFSLVWAGENPAGEESPGEFVARKQREMAQHLKDLQDAYRSCCAAEELSRPDPVSLEAIQEALPKPRELRFIFNRSGPEGQPVSREPFKKEEGVRSLPGKLGEPFINTPFPLSGGRSRTQAGAIRVAQDALSGELLGLNTRFTLSGWSGTLLIEQPLEKCCTAFKPYSDDPSYTGSYHTPSGMWLRGLCTGFAKSGAPYYHPLEINLLASGEDVVNFRLKTSGLSVAPSGGDIRFSGSGLAFLSGEIGESFRQEGGEIQECYRMVNLRADGGDAGAVYGGNGSTSHGKRFSAPQSTGMQKKEVFFDVFRFKGIFFEGQEYTRSGSMMGSTDLFSPRGQPFNALTLLPPLLLIEHGGDRVGSSVQQKVPADGGALGLSPVPFKYEHIEGSSVLLSQQGRIAPQGTPGKTAFRLSLGQGTWFLNGDITTNLYAMELDSAMEKSLVALGRTHPVRIRVAGPANLETYRIQWQGKGWLKASTAFVRQGEFWIAENEIRIQDDNLMGKVVTLGVQASRSQEPRPSGRDLRGLNQLVWEARFQVVPGIGDLGLELAAKGQMPTDRGVDLFFPNHLEQGMSVWALPVFRDAGGRSLPPDVQEGLKKVPVRLHSDAPMVLRMVNGLTGQVTGQVGSAGLVAEITEQDAIQSGMVLPLARKDLRSRKVQVNVNQLLLYRNAPEGRKVPWRLQVVGSADMGESQAVWHTGGGRMLKPFVRGGDGHWISSLETSESVTGVEILRKGFVLARLPVENEGRRGFIPPQASIRMLPIRVPGTLVDTVTPVDMGSLMSLSECRDQLRLNYPGVYATAGNDTLNAVCRPQREADRERIREERALQKDQQKIVRELVRQGRQLVVFNDTAELSAVINGFFDPERMLCRWRVEKGGSLDVREKETLIRRVGQDGVCQTTLAGFEGDFDIEALAVVELIYVQPESMPGQFSGGASQFSSTVMDRNALETWVKQ